MSGGARGTTAELTALLRDSSLTWTQRRTRLQGWRGEAAEQADANPFAQRIGPGVCAAGAFLGVATSSPLVLAVFAGTALLGAFAPNHPFEQLYNRLASSAERPPLPRNCAAKRLGCLMGVAFLGGAAVAYVLGASTLGAVLAIVLGGTATFVAVTGICVPSILFTLLWGAQRAQAPSLAAACTMPRAHLPSSASEESHRYAAGAS
jgi:hypothetical protein